jgi:DNA-binding transcriptional regulator YdaS (Cro superfamily)
MKSNSAPLVAPVRTFEENMRVAIKRLALEVTRNGTIEELGTLIGTHPVTVSTWISLGRVPPRKARFIESLFGREHVRAEELSPEISA